MEKRKEEATSRFPTSSVYRYKFLFFGTEVCQPAPFGYCYYNRATEKSKDLPLRKFVPRSRFFKIWDGMFKIGKEFFDRSANDTFFTRNILEIPIHLPNATYRSISRVKERKRKSKKKRSINQRNVSTRMHRCTRSLRGNKQANIKISRGWNGKRE